MYSGVQRCTAEPARLELAAFRSTAGCSGQLSYDSVCVPRRRATTTCMGGGSRVSSTRCARRRRRRDTVVPRSSDRVIVKKRSAPPGRSARVGREGLAPSGEGVAATAVDAPPRVPCRRSYRIPAPSPAVAARSPRRPSHSRPCPTHGSARRVARTRTAWGRAWRGSRWSCERRGGRGERATAGNAKVASPMSGPRRHVVTSGWADPRRAWRHRIDS